MIHAITRSQPGKLTRQHFGKWLAVWVLLGLGCREELGPEPMPTTRVSGKVHIRNRPVVGGWIEFSPADGTVGKTRSARLRPDGSFNADRVSLGRNAILIAHSSTTLPGSPQEVPFGASPFERAAIIRREIDKVPETTIDIDLQDEYLRLIREFSSRPRAGPRP